MDLVLDAVETGHQHRGEAEIRVGSRIGEADLDALGLGRGAEGDAAGSRAVARRIGEQDRGLEAGNQALVGVGRGVGEGVDCLGVLDDAADVEKAGLGQACIFVAGKRRLAVLPDRLVHVHARAVIAIDGLRHEGCGLAIGVGNLVDRVLVDLHLVGVAGQRVELDAQLVLRGSHLMVVLFDHDAHLGNHGQHLGTHVLQAVHRRDREIAALDARTVTHVAGLVVGIVVGRQFGRVQLEAGVVGIGLVLHVVEHEELGFGADIDRVADTLGLEVGFCLLGGAARVTVIGFARDRIENVADQHHGRLREERVHVRRLGVGHQHHVGLVDRLPARDRGPVEHHAVGKHVLVHRRNVHRDVLPLALRVGEAQIDVLHVVVLDLLENIVGCGHLFFL